MCSRSFLKLWVDIENIANTHRQHLKAWHFQECEDMFTNTHSLLFEASYLPVRSMISNSEESAHEVRYNYRSSSVSEAVMRSSNRPGSQNIHMQSGMIHYRKEPHNRNAYLAKSTKCRQWSMIEHSNTTPSAVF